MLLNLFFCLNCDSLFPVTKIVFKQLHFNALISVNFCNKISFSGRSESQKQGFIKCHLNTIIGQYLDYLCKGQIPIMIFCFVSVVVKLKTEIINRYLTQVKTHFVNVLLESSPSCKHFTVNKSDSVLVNSEISA